ncbi:MAG: GTP cyclohydrolase I FolE [Acidobacteriota bacterium]|nr:GTP cyclohydrolase I FolE [Acidobacteriota bacterium]
MAIQLSQILKLPIVEKDKIRKATLVVDDLADSGQTRDRYPNNDFACLYNKPHTPLLQGTVYISDTIDRWIEFFWEREVNEQPAEDAVTRLIEMVGEDPAREGLVETPKRVIKSYKTLFSGYKQRPKDIIKTFDADGYDQLVLLKDIEIYSMCEHHVLPFLGKAHIAYIPDKKVIGISKLARIADMFARRLQIQERLADNITSTLMEYLRPLGAACVIEAQHLCMRMRGVSKQNSIMVTSSLKGLFLEDSEKGRAARKEFMGLIK